MFRVRILLIVGVLMALSGRTVEAISVGQVDDFEDNTTMGWRIGGVGTPFPVNIPTNGPAGLGDSFLQNNSAGFGPGGKQVVLNRAQWTGDFLAAGVSGITIDVNNFSLVPLDLRLALDVDTQQGSLNRIVSTEPIVVPASSGWVNVTFPTTPDAFTLLAGTSVENTLSNVADFRLFHGGVAWPPPGLTSSVGYDNITAVGPTPDEPTGDFDGDNDVDGDDFLIWQANFGMTGTSREMGDADGDGDTDGDDFLVWQAKFGMTGTPASVSVPEPASWGLLLVGLLWTCRRGRAQD